MAKKIAKTLCGLTVVMAAVGGVLAYLKIRDQKDSLDEDFDDFTDGFEDQDSSPERTYTTLSKTTRSEEDEDEDEEESEETETSDETAEDEKAPQTAEK